MAKVEKVLSEATLCFPIIGENSVILAEKQCNIGEGCFNGYGGGIEPGETSIQSIIRELWEEGCVKATPGYLEKMAIVDFYNMKSDGSVFACKVHVFLLYAWMGHFQHTKEMRSPTVFDKRNLPFDRMMLADRKWLPPILWQKKIIGSAKYGPFQQRLLEPMNQIYYVDSLPDY